VESFEKSPLVIILVCDIAQLNNIATYKKTGRAERNITYLFADVQKNIKLYLCP
jgi:hypothetical protein